MKYFMITSIVLFLTLYYLISKIGHLEIQLWLVFKSE